MDEFEHIGILVTCIGLIYSNLAMDKAILQHKPLLLLSCDRKSNLPLIS